MEENSPFLPWIFQGTLKFFNIGHYPETTLRIRMLEWIYFVSKYLCDLRCYPCGKIQERLGGLARQMFSQLQQCVLICFTHIIQPLDRNTVFHRAPSAV